MSNFRCQDCRWHTSTGLGDEQALDAACQHEDRTGHLVKLVVAV